MSDSSNSQENPVSRDEQEMKKYNNNSNLSLAGALLLGVAGIALFFFGLPIAAIALIGAGVVAAGIGVYQAFQYGECKKRVENAKKGNGGGKSNEVSNKKNIEKELDKQQDIEKDIKINFLPRDQQPNNSAQKNNDIKKEGKCSLNMITGVSRCNANHKITPGNVPNVPNVQERSIGLNCTG